MSARFVSVDTGDHLLPADVDAANLEPIRDVAVGAASLAATAHDTATLARPRTLPLTSPRLPTFEDLGTLLDVTDTAVDTLYWPWLFHAERYLADPLGPWYLYYSTDHDPGDGGIYLAVGDSPIGPFTEHGLVYVDTTDGSQTETPAVMWNEVNQRVNLYHQQAGVTSANGVQSSLLAHSEDGVAGWTRHGVIIDIPNSPSYLGSGHTGYLVPHRDGSAWWAWHLMGGSEAGGTCGVSYSDDGETWTTDRRHLAWAADQVPAGRLVSWNHSTVVDWYGTPLCIGLTNGMDGGVSTKTASIFMAPVSADRRSLRGRLAYVDLPGFAEANIRSLQAFVVDGRVHLYYSISDEGVATRIGVLRSLHPQED